MKNRPAYHFAPKTNWMNDPNGTVYRDGKYHLFYQYNPAGSSWGNICWAYAVSEDLVNWTRKGVRLAPEASRGEQYCFSGCVVPMGEGYLMVYTSIGFEEWAIQQHARQRFALADKDFVNIKRLYEKDLTEASQPFPVREWRDPFLFRFRNSWYFVLCGIRWISGHSENAVLLYRAKDETLVDWEYVGILATENDHVIECPNVAVFGDRIALLYSTMTDRKVKYIAGDFDGERLWERRRGVVDWSLKSFYATNLSAGEGGKTVLYGWMPEDLSGGDSPDGSYSGCLAVPRLMEMDAAYALRFAPVPALESLAQDSLELAGGKVRSDTTSARIRFTLRGEGRFLLTAGDRERVTVTLEGGRLRVGRDTNFPMADTAEAVMNAGEASGYRFDILIDGSATEIFVNDSAVLSFRMYRTEQPERLFELVAGEIKDFSAERLAPAAIVGD